MKKLASFAGPAAALIAMKCPFCLLALAGIGAGVGSLAPVVQGTYWAALLGLAGIFVWFLFRRWRASHVQSWVLAVAILGAAALIYQAIAELEGLFAYLPVASLSTAAIASLLGRRAAQDAGCAQCATIANEGAKKVLEPSPGGKPDTSIKEEQLMAKRKVEVFTSGCPVCEPVVDLVKKSACPSCDVVVYDLNTGCATNECRDKAKKYGITRVPAVVVDGRLLDCCRSGTVGEKELRAAGVGSP